MSQMCTRRDAAATLAALWWGTSLAQAASPVVSAPTLDAAQSRAFRAWFVAIVQDQVRRGPTPRWVHRDCAGLVRFAAAQAMTAHDAGWLKSMGWPTDKPLPGAELALSDAQQPLRNAWSLPNGDRAAYASAIAIVQNNTRFLGKAQDAIAPGDLLFFDQGDDQHLMVWTGRSVMYHTGADLVPNDTGLRSTTLAQLQRHTDTRWRPVPENPNFGGWFRFRFLSA